MHRNAAQFVVKKLIKPSKSRPKACRVGPASFSLPSGSNVGSGRFEPVLLFGQAQMSVGTTVVAMSVNDVPLTAVALRDKLAPFARSCVAQLEMSGVQAKPG